MLIGKSLGYELLRTDEKESTKHSLASFINLAARNKINRLGLREYTPIQPSLVTTNPETAFELSKKYSGDQNEIDKLHGHLMPEHIDLILKNHVKRCLKETSPFYWRGATYLPIEETGEMNPQSEFSKDVGLNQYLNMSGLNEISSAYLIDLYYNNNPFTEIGIELYALFNLIGINYDDECDLTTIAMTEKMNLDKYEKHKIDFNTEISPILGKFQNLGGSHTEKAFHYASLFLQKLNASLKDESKALIALGYSLNSLETVTLSNICKFHDIKLI